jgi:hypothetical protein
VLGSNRALLAVSVVSLSLSVPLSVGGADAAPAKATHCTIVGTPQADRLVGTAKSDVICGRGGDDTLVGKGGDDVLVGGAGTDDLRGGAGEDVLEAGSGADRLSGGDGADREIAGGGADVALGGDGRDHIAGGRGNDDLTGGPRADTIEGGPGTNWCTIDPADTADQCVYDRTPAVADAVDRSSDTVDVSEAEQSVTLRIHVTDDTGATGVVVNPTDATPYYPSRTGAHLVSGDSRDGWWEATITFPRWIRPGTFVPVVHTFDRLGRQDSETFFDSSIAVLDEQPDLDLPELTLLSPTPDQSFDDRVDGATIPLKAHITDVGSGVDPQHMFVLLWSPSPGGTEAVGYGGSLRLASGDRHDGIWKGSVYVGQGEPGGDWNLDIFVSDEANHGTEYGAEYWGPGMFGGPGNFTYRENRPIPDGMGSVHIIGNAPDTEAPTMDDVSITPTMIDTLSGPATLDISADVADTGGSGLLAVSAILRPVDWTTDTPRIDTGLSRGDGSSTDGTWTGQLTVPQGLPPGAYYVEFLVIDHADNESAYIGADFPGSWFSERLATGTAITVVDSSGT